MIIFNDLLFCQYIGCFFFFNDTSTTEIYTYLHTLSLHDARPISATPAPQPKRPDAFAPREGDEPMVTTIDALPVIPVAPVVALHSSASTGAQRSEEHTSELQSLMRISYAVFCLKKKNNTINKTTDNDKKYIQKLSLNAIKK